MNKKKTSIKMKLIGIITPVIIVAVTLLIIIAYGVSKNIIEENSKSLLNSSINNQSTQIENWLEENLASFETVKRYMEGTSLSKEELNHMLEQYYDYDSDFPEGLYIGTEKGDLIKAQESQKASQDLLNSSWYTQGLTRVNMAFGTAYTNENGENIISASGIINDKSGELSVLSADVPLDHVSVIVNSMVEMKGAQAFLVDTTDYTILAHRDSERISATMSEEDDDKFMADIASRIKANDMSTVEIDDNLVAFEKVSGTEWVLVSFVPNAVIFADLYNLRTIMIIIAVVSLIVLVLLIERVVHIVIKPVKGITDDIKRMAEGDFTIEIATKGNDEIAVMGESVKNFIESMRDMIASLKTVSTKMGEQAEGSITVSKELYDSSVVQSDSMKELNITVDQLSSSVNEIAESATTLAMLVSDTKQDGDKVNDKMKETVDLSEKGKQDMQQVGEAMSNIGNSISKLEVVVNKVGTASEEITNIVSLIGNIAEETNLLALNASIEAARAGEAGRGFAVVAAEIGKLASTSAEAVLNIQKLIDEVIVLVGDTVKQTEESAANIKENGEMIQEAIDTFGIIFKNIEVTNELIKEMLDKVDQVDAVATNAAAISEEQAASTDEIMATAENMVVQSNNIMKNSESVASDADDLAKTSEELEQQISIFRI